MFTLSPLPDHHLKNRTKKHRMKVLPTHKVKPPQNDVKILVKSYRCPKFDGDAKQTLEIRVERKRNLKLGELGGMSFRMLKLGELGEVSF